jgi:PAS domain S-box-containing protein
MVRFIKENSRTFAAVVACSVLSAALSTWVYLNARNVRIDNRKDILANQVQLCSNDLERSVHEFQEDFYYFILDNDSILSGKEIDSLALTMNLKNFLTHHLDLVDTIHITSADFQWKSYLDKNEVISLERNSNIDESILDKLDLVDFQYVPEYNYLAYRHEGLLFVLSANPSRFIKDRIKNYYLGDGGFKFVYNDYYGLVPFESPQEVANLDVNQFFSSEALNQIISHTKEATIFDQTLEVSAAGTSKKILLQQYPIRIFNSDYALLFASDLDAEMDGMTSLLIVVALSSIMLITLVVLMFSLNSRQLRKTSESLSSSKEELSALVRQQKLLFEYSEDFTYRFDVNENYDYVSENVERVLGFTPDQFMRKENRKVTDNPVNEHGILTKRLVLEKGQESGVFYQELHNSQSEPRMLEMKEKPFRDEHGVFAGVIGIAKDVTERFAADQKFRVLFEHSSDPYFIYDQSGIIDCNEVALKTLELKSKELIIGKHLSDYSPEKQSDGRLSAYKSEEMDNLAYEYGFHKFEWVHQKSSGTEFPVEVTLTTVHLNNKRMILCVWHDLTERKRVEQVLIESRKRAEELASQKQQFLSSMSHEIRTPLNAVIGITHFLMEDNPKPEQQDKLRSLKFSADNLLSLVNDILDHSKIESGKIIFSRDQFDLHDRLTGIHEVMKIKADRKNVELDLNITGDLPKYVVGDPVRLNQILLNLVSNAVKFTEKGSVWIKAELLGSTKEHDEIQISVKDTGIGIPSDQLERIFETFTQADEKILNTFGGTGLGLAITKKLVELQGGTISVSSEEGVGSEFVFKISFKKASGERKETATILKEDKELDHNIQGAHVLLVEDNPINQKIASQFLNNWGAQVTVADNGRVALEKVAQKSFDFILMDIQMPEMDGYEATRAIRAIEEDYFKTIPIISLTADAFSEVRERVLDAGMDDYVTKPINPTQFLKTISKYYRVRA